MLNNPRFSVIMSVYANDNAENFEAAVRSVTVDQTVPPDELVLVVDGPVPSELEQAITSIERSLAESLVLIRLEENRGHGNASRVAISHTANELVARMDSDDIAIPTRFEQELALFEADPSLDVVGGNIAEFAGSVDNVVSIRDVPKYDSDIRRHMVHRCAMNHMTAMYKKTAVQAAGNYIDWYCDEDYYLWLRMMQNGSKFANTGTVLVNVRIDEGMYARRGGMRYFRSEKALQDYMLENGVIGKTTYLTNVAKRFAVQVAMPTSARAWVFRHFARRKPKAADNEAMNTLTMRS